MTTDLTLDLFKFLPELALACFALLFLVVGSFGGLRSTGLVTVLSIAALIIVAGELATNPIYMTSSLAFHGMVMTDGWAVTLKITILIGLAVVLLMFLSTAHLKHFHRFEVPILVLLAGLGMMIMVSAHDFLTVYVGLELSALAFYVLASMQRDQDQSAEAGMKYFVLGALSSGMLLFGISLVYGFVGTTNFAGVSTILGQADGQNAGAIVGLAFIMAGLAFKISAVPFHMWTPDVYQGAPTVVTALLAAVPKLAAMGLLIRMLSDAFAPLSEDAWQILIFLSVSSMMWGAIAAVGQRNIKRLLAYGSIANIGYALMGVVVGGADGLASTMFYMTIYMVTTLGAFAVLMSLRDDKGDDIQSMNSLAGLSRQSRVAAYGLAIMMLGMAGLPPLAGFMGKLVVFTEVVQAGYLTLAIVGVLASVIAAYYYLKVIKIMFFDEPAAGVTLVWTWPLRVVVALTVIFVIGLIVVPSTLLTPFHLAALSLVS